MGSARITLSSTFALSNTPWFGFISSSTTCSCTSCASAQSSCIGRCSHTQLIAAWNSFGDRLWRQKRVRLNSADTALSEAVL